MRYRLLGRSGLRVSEVALGTMTFGDEWGWGAPKEECRRIFHAFADAGGNFIDTANRYTEGSAEEIVGELVASDRDHFVIATKYSLYDRRGDPNFSGNHRKNMVRSLEASLKRLNTDAVDLFWVHAWDFTVPVDEVMRGLDDLVRAGKVLHVGISDSPAWIAAQANTLAELRGWSPFVALQASYSLLDRSAERDLFPMARAFGMAMTAWGSLEAGLLSGKYNRRAAAPAAGSSDGASYTGRAQRWGDVVPANLERAQVVADLADELGATAAQVATAWVRAQPGVMIPILGARTQAQIADTLGALKLRLAPEEMERLNKIAPPRLGFPQEFLASENVRDLLSGGTWDWVER